MPTDRATDMTTTNLSDGVRHLCRTAFAAEPDPAADGQLLESFVARRDEAAFDALVRRHGRMVLGVCLRVLGNRQDAEDAFQAAFLVLAKRADAVRPRELVGNWLHGVAYRTALQARSAAARRRAREVQVNQLPDTPTAEREPWLELQPVLDEELNRLPRKYRAPVVLCELEGRSRKDVAQQMGIPEGTLSSRLAAARKLLADRLTRRGLVLPAAGLGVVFGELSASASVPTALVSPTVQAAALVAAGDPTAAGIVSAEVAALAKGVMKGMFLSKLKLVSAMAVALGLAVGGAGVVTSQAFADGEKPKVGPKDGEKPAGPRDGDKPKVGPKDGDAPKPGPREGDAPRPGPKDGEKPNPGPKDGEKPRTGPKDGEKPRTGPKDGEKPGTGPKDGEKPGTASVRNTGEAVTLTGTISKREVKGKRDDGSEVTTVQYLLTEAGGNAIPVPAPRVGEGGKPVDTGVSVADFVGKTVTLTGRAYVVKPEGGGAARVSKVIGVTDIKEKK